MNPDFANTLEVRLQMVAPRFELFIGEAGKQNVHCYRYSYISWFHPPNGSPFKLEMHAQLIAVNSFPWFLAGLN